MFEVTARLTIRDGELEGFERQAAEMMRLTRERDTKTLRYDWFVTDDGTECEVREGYTDADGHHMTLYAEPSPALAALIARLSGHVRFTQFEYFQSLDSPPREKTT